MTKQDKINKSEIITFYMDYTLNNNEVPGSVYLFAKEYSFEEQEFYKYFSSFESIEKEIFEVFYENTIHILEQSKEYEEYDSRNKLLSFYFTFFENLTANRSYVIHALEQSKNPMKRASLLKKLKHSFTTYIENLDIELLDIKQKEIVNAQRKLLKESAWTQLLLTIEFWKNDTSSSFEKTDVFIEKSVNASFDILNVAPLKSVIDLGKFMFKEKMKKS